MATPEGKVKAKIKQALDRLGAYYFMPVQNGMGAPGLDFYVCHQGLFIGIEAKAPGKKPTPRQITTMRKIQGAGGYTLVIDGQDGIDTLIGALAMLGEG